MDRDQAHQPEQPSRWRASPQQLPRLQPARVGHAHDLAAFRWKIESRISRAITSGGLRASEVRNDSPLASGTSSWAFFNVMSSWRRYIVMSHIQRSTNTTYASTSDGMLVFAPAVALKP